MTRAPQPEPLLPCPFCGCPDRIEPSKMYNMMVCQNCYALGPYGWFYGIMGDVATREDGIAAGLPEGVLSAEEWLSKNCKPDDWNRLEESLSDSLWTNNVLQYMRQYAAQLSQAKGEGYEPDQCTVTVSAEGWDEIECRAKLFGKLLSAAKNLSFMAQTTGRDEGLKQAINEISPIILACNQFIADGTCEPKENDCTGCCNPSCECNAAPQAEDKTNV